MTLIPMERTIRSATGRQWKVIGIGQGAGGPAPTLCAWFWLGRLAQMAGKAFAVVMMVRSTLYARMDGQTEYLRTTGCLIYIGREGITPVGLSPSERASLGWMHNGARGFPALRFPARFTPRVRGPIGWGALSAEAPRVPAYFTSSSPLGLCWGVDPLSPGAPGDPGGAARPSSSAGRSSTRPSSPTVLAQFTRPTRNHIP